VLYEWVSAKSVSQSVHVSCVSSKIGEDQSAEDAEDGPPELLVRDVTHRCLSQWNFVLFSLASTSRWLQYYCGAQLCVIKLKL